MKLSKIAAVVVLVLLSVPIAFAAQPGDELSLSTRKTPLAGTAPERLVALAAESEKIVVIVGVDVEGGWNVADTRHPEKGVRQRQKARDTKDRILRRHRGAVPVAGRDFRFIPFYTLAVDEKTLRNLMKDDDVVSIEENNGAERTLAESTEKIGSRAANLSGYTGLGSTVVVIDDGVKRDHKFIKGSMYDTKQACFSGADYDPDGDGISVRSLCPGQRVSVPNNLRREVNVAAPCSNCYHGTEVAGVIAGIDVNNNLYGVAPDAELLPIQVYSYRNATCTSPGCPTEARRTDVLAALEYVHDWSDHDTFAAVNLSLRFRNSYGSRQDCISGNNSVQNALATLRVDDIASVVAAGNEGTSTQFSAPSCLNYTYVVGATTDWDDIASYSNTYSFLSFFAPGGSLNSNGTVQTGYGIKTSALSGGYTETAGTSLAAPHVSGAFALLRQRHPTKSVGLLYNYLRDTGTLIMLPGGTFVPRINVDAALNQP